MQRYEMRQRVQLVIGVVLLPLLLIVAPAAVAAPVGATVEVQSTQPWTDTGLDVVAGRPASVAASGSIRIAWSDPGKSPSADTPGRPEATGVDCVAENVDGRAWTAPGLYCWTLIARIGTDGVPFEVDNGMRFTPTTSGRLYLGVNDETNAFGDNSGSWTAEVRPDSPWCPMYTFVGVRGSGESATDRGGFGAPLAAHRYFLQREFGRDVETFTVDYWAAGPGDDDLSHAGFLAAYAFSLADGKHELHERVMAVRDSCYSTRIALAGYSQGAHVIGTWLDDGGPTTTGARVVRTTLYGDPRHSDDVQPVHRWVNVSANDGQIDPTGFRGLAVAFGPYSEFTYTGESLRSWCTYSVGDDGTATPDPVCAVPEDISGLAALEYTAEFWVGLHDQYERKVVPTAVQEIIAGLRGD
jgi:hypothetical protein